MAADKGLFAQEGVDVELIQMEDDTATLAALFAGQIDALATATQVTVASNEPDEEALACVLMLDDSRGGDGILATTTSRPSPTSRARSVAFGHRSVSQFYVNVLLKEVGLSEADIEVVDLRADEAAEAFMMQEVDAAVTWEPYLTQGRNARAWPSADRHLGATRAARRLPGDQGQHLQRPQGGVPGASPAPGMRRCAMSRAHPAEANADHGARMGDWLEDPAVFAEILRGVGLYDADENREYFGTPERPGQIYQTMQYAIDVWTDLGVLRAKLAPADVIAHGIYDE